MKRDNPGATFTVIIVGLLSWLQVLGIVMSVKNRTETAVEAVSYFDRRCRADAGEFVMRRVKGVEGIVQLRPRAPVESFTPGNGGSWPEDPFGHSAAEGRAPWRVFVPDSYRFFESRTGPRVDPKGRVVLTRDLEKFEHPLSTQTVDPDSLGACLLTRYINDCIAHDRAWWRYSGYAEQPGKRPVLRVNRIEQPLARYGYTWREFRSSEDIHHGVYGSETTIIDLERDEVIAVRRGYAKMKDAESARKRYCPQHSGGYSDRHRPLRSFVESVLVPAPVPVEAEEHDAQSLARETWKPAAGTIVLDKYRRGAPLMASSAQPQAQQAD